MSPAPAAASHVYDAQPNVTYQAAPQVTYQAASQISYQSAPQAAPQVTYQTAPQVSYQTVQPACVSAPAGYPTVPQVSYQTSYCAAPQVQTLHAPTVPQAPQPVAQHYPPQPCPQQGLQNQLFQIQQQLQQPQFHFHA